MALPMSRMNQLRPLRNSLLCGINRVIMLISISAMEPMRSSSLDHKRYRPGTYRPGVQRGFNKYLASPGSMCVCVCDVSSVMALLKTACGRVYIWRRMPTHAHRHHQDQLFPERMANRANCFRSTQRHALQRHQRTTRANSTYWEIPLEGGGRLPPLTQCNARGPLLENTETPFVRQVENNCFKWQIIPKTCSASHRQIREVGDVSFLLVYINYRFGKNICI